MYRNVSMRDVDPGRPGRRPAVHVRRNFECGRDAAARSKGADRDGIEDSLSGAVHSEYLLDMLTAREAALAQREADLWKRAEVLADLKASLLERERSAAAEREARLFAHLEVLVSRLSGPPPHEGLAVARGSDPQATGGSVSAVSSGNGGHVPDMAASGQPDGAEGAAHAPGHASSRVSGDGDRADAAALHATAQTATAQTAKQPTGQRDAGALVLNAMQMVANGADPMADVDFLAPPLAQPSSAVNTSSLPRRPTDAAPVSSSAGNAAGASPPASNGAHVASKLASAAGMGGAAAFAAAAAAGAAELDVDPDYVETRKAAPDGPPPELKMGDDDICWVGRLQASLLSEGFYCGEDDDADFVFGNGTQAAVMTFQACNSLSETGIADAATWAALPQPWADADRAGNGSGSHGRASGTAPSAPESDHVDLHSSGSVAASRSGVGGTAFCVDAPNSAPTDTGIATDTASDSGRAAGAASKFGGLFDDFGAALGWRKNDRFADDPSATKAEDGGARADEQDRPLAGVASAAAKTYSEWPTLREGDGERAVHSMHVKLKEAGFHADDDDVKWWQFGPSTVSALQTFQACSGLPESGVCDPKTWEALMGQGATAHDISSVFSGDSDDEDLEHEEGSVYLLGEQRWARKL